MPQISEVHVLGSSAGEAAEEVLARAQPGALILDFTSGKLGDAVPHAEEVSSDDHRSEVDWINAEVLAPAIGDASREAYVEWLAKAAEKDIAGSYSIKEWFTYNDEISFWWFTDVSVRHPTQHPYRWLFYQIHAIRRVADQKECDEAPWHIWSINSDEARTLQEAVPEQADTMFHTSIGSTPDTWLSRFWEILEQYRLGETLLTLQRGIYSILRSAKTYYQEVQRTTGVSHLNGSSSLHPENRDRPLILVRTGFPNSWTKTEDEDWLPENTEWYDHYLQDTPWRLWEHGYAVGWLPYTLQAQYGQWEHARENQPIPDATPWMAFTGRDMAHVLFHQVKWLFLYIWLFVWLRVHERWRYDGIPLGAWLKSAYQRVWSTHDFVEVEKCRTACDELRPDAVLYRDEFYGSGRRVSAGTPASTTTVGLQHGMINREHTVYQWSAREVAVAQKSVDYVQNAPVPDWFAAFGSYYRDQFEEWGGYPAERVLPIGGLRHDVLVEKFDLARQGKSRKTSEQRQEFGLPTQTPVVLLCTGVPKQAGFLFRTVVQGLRKAELDAFVAVKLHQYHGGQSRVRQVAQELSFSSFTTYENHVYALMAASDLLVAGTSTVVLEGNLFGLHTIAMCGHRRYQPYPFEEDDLSAVVTNAREMGMALRKGYKGKNARSPKLDRHLRNADGKACERLATALSQRIGDNETEAIN